MFVFPWCITWFYRSACIFFVFAFLVFLLNFLNKCSLVYNSHHKTNHLKLYPHCCYLDLNFEQFGMNYILTILSHKLIFYELEMFDVIHVILLVKTKVYPFHNFFTSDLKSLSIYSSENSKKTLSVSMPNNSISISRKK